MCAKRTLNVVDNPGTYSAYALHLYFYLLIGFLLVFILYYLMYNPLVVPMQADFSSDTFITTCVWYQWQFFAHPLCLFVLAHMLMFKVFIPMNLINNDIEFVLLLFPFVGMDCLCWCIVDLVTIGENLYWCKFLC